MRVPHSGKFLVAQSGHVLVVFLIWGSNGVNPFIPKSDLIDFITPDDFTRQRETPWE